MQYYSIQSEINHNPHGLWSHDYYNEGRILWHFIEEGSNVTNGGIVFESGDAFSFFEEIQKNYPGIEPQNLREGEYYLIDNQHGDIQARIEQIVEIQPEHQLFGSLANAKY